MFGAMATASLETGTVTGIVGDNGELYLSGMPEKGEFLLSWGQAADEKCKAAYHITHKPDDTSLGSNGCDLSLKEA